MVEVVPELSFPVLIVVTGPTVEQLTAFDLPAPAPLILTSAVPAGKPPAGRAAGAGSEQPATPQTTTNADAPAMNRLSTITSIPLPLIRRHMRRM
jgi:hypothetical protein